jgi:hypothetical protein
VYRKYACFTAHYGTQCSRQDVLYMTIAKPHRHVHAREYWAEFEATPLLEWLNSKGRPHDDPVEEVIRLNQQPPMWVRGSEIKAREQEIISYVGEIVRLSKLAIAPVVGRVLSPKRWLVDWRLVGKFPPMQGLAFLRVLQLAEKGALARVRRCGYVECGRWYFARFEHKDFCSTRCQQKAIRSSPEWKEKRRNYMKRLRHENKMRDQRAKEFSRMKRKGERR